MLLRPTLLTTAAVSLAAFMTVLAVAADAAAVTAEDSPAAETKSSSLQECECAPGVLLTVVLTLLVASIVVGASYLFWKYYWSVKYGNHLVLVTDVEKGATDFAFDNPGFKEGSPTATKKAAVDTQKSNTKWITFNENTSMKLGNGKSTPPYGAVSYPVEENERQKQSADQTMNVVPLRSHDFTGLGFNICGNMRDGIFIKDLLHRGPASESGHIKPGDRIAAVRINFSHMVYEDAVAILSCASPYEVEVEIDHNSSWPTGSLKNKSKENGHTFYRGQSFSDGQVQQRNSTATENETSNISSESGPPAILQVSAVSEKMPKYGGVKVLPDLNSSVNGKDIAKPNRMSTDNREQQNISTTTASPSETVEDKKINRISVVSDFDEVDLTNEGNNNNDNRHLREQSNNNNNSNHNHESGKETNVKSIIVKGFQNIKDKINSHLQRTSGGTNGDHKISAEKNPATQKPDSKSTEDEDSVTKNGEYDGHSMKPSKKKAPQPPSPSQETVVPALGANLDSSLLTEIDKEVSKNTGNNDPLDDTDSEKEVNVIANGNIVELNASHITIHHQSAPDENDRKAASLGDLSKITSTFNEQSTVAVLERAVSLELAETPQKKRKAPIPPQEDAISDEIPYGKEFAVIGENSRLKKSSLFGTLEEALKRQESNDEDDNVSILSIPDDDSLISSTPMKTTITTMSAKFKDDNNLEDDIFLDPIEDTATPPDLPKSPMPTLSSSYVTEITVINKQDETTSVVPANNKSEMTLFVTAFETSTGSSDHSKYGGSTNDDENDDANDRSISKFDRASTNNYENDAVTTARDGDNIVTISSSSTPPPETEIGHHKIEVHRKSRTVNGDVEGPKRKRSSSDENEKIIATTVLNSIGGNFKYAKANGNTNNVSGKAKSPPSNKVNNKTTIGTSPSAQQNAKITVSRIPVRANTEPNLKFSLSSRDESGVVTICTGKAKQPTNGAKFIPNGHSDKKVTSNNSKHNLSARKSLSPVRLNGPHLGRSSELSSSVYK